jgi:hypothetical protein
VTDTPPAEDDDLLASATLAPEARQHHRSRSHRRRKGLKPLDIAGIVVAVLVVLGVVVVIAKGHKSTSSAIAKTTTTAATPTTAAHATSSTAAAGGPGPNATTWTFTSLDGKAVTITKGTAGTLRFAVYDGNSLPLTVIGIEKALAKNDCASVEAVYNSNKATNPTSTANSNLRRSAYAHYAVVQASAKGCAWAKAINPTN